MSISICEKCIHSPVCGAEDEGMIQCLFFLREDEIKPVVHARWIEHSHMSFDGGYNGADYECSHCGFNDLYDTEGCNYCTNCGAKMDLED